MTGPVVGDHLRASPSASVSDGPALLPGATYRVVGAAADDLALLRVTDATGTRRYTGDVVRVPAERVPACLEPTGNPDAGLALRHRLRTLCSGLYWSVRRFLP